MFHLVRRFFGALWPGPPRAGDLDWVAEVLEPGEYELFRRLPNHDQRHLIRVAHKLERILEGTPWEGDDLWVAVALLHDVGKYDAKLSPYGRAIATVCGVAAPGMAGAWSTRSGFTRRVGLYLLHGELGADMIRLAGGREEAALWSIAHNRSGQRHATGFPDEIIEALLEADG